MPNRSVGGSRSVGRADADDAHTTLPTIGIAAAAPSEVREEVAASHDIVTQERVAMSAC